MKNYRSRGKARVLLNSSYDGAAIIDGKGTFLAANDALEEVTGLNYKELVGTPLLKLNIITSESKMVILEILWLRDCKRERSPIFALVFNILLLILFA